MRGLSSRKDVLGNAEVVDQTQFLKNGANPRRFRLLRVIETDFLVAQINLTAIRFQRPGQDLDQGGFAGAILANQTQDFAAPYIQVHLIQLHAGEGLGDTFNL